jgi:hypothetical protein
MATVVEHECFSEDLCNKLHDMNSDTFKLYFTNTAPSASADLVLTDLPTEIANGNGYTTGGLSIAFTIPRSGGQTTITGAQVVLTATGAVGPFRYICAYNFTAAGDNCFAFFDHGSSITMANTDTYTIPAGAWATVN